MIYIPIYERGTFAGIKQGENYKVCGRDPANSDYQAFLKWLESENKTLETWLAENPPPAPKEPTKEELVKAAECKLLDHIADVSKMLLEVREKLTAATGAKLDPVPAELAAKLAAVETLKAG